MRSMVRWVAVSGWLLCAAACGEDSSGSSAEESTGGSDGNPRDTGGAESTGGAQANGGAEATGGAQVNGGAEATGGAAATGGTRATGGSGTTGPITAETPEQYFAAFADLFCAGLAECCGEAGFEFSEEYCRSLLAGAAATTEGLTYDRAAGESCLNDLQGRIGGCASTGPLICNGVFLGTVELGGECDQDADCVPSELGEMSCEIVGSQATSEICVVNIRAGEGEPCVESCFVGSSVRSCLNAVPGSDDGNPERGKCYADDELFCDSQTLTCVPTFERGEACYGSHECGAYAVCDGVCVDGRGEGEECFAFSECQEGLLCSIEENTCDADPAAPLEGACSTFSGQ